MDLVSWCAYMRRTMRLCLAEETSAGSFIPEWGHRFSIPQWVKCWVIPPKQSAEFVCQMESVLSVYQRTYHPDFPLVCLDESLKQLVTETRTPIPTQPGQPERFDYQYERNGTANLFMLANPIEGWRTVEVTKQRTAIDYAHVLKKLVDDYYPEAWMITVVQDNLNTHTPASLYKAFEPSEARRIINRLDFCYTPKHGRHVKYGRD